MQVTLKSENGTVYSFDVFHQEPPDAFMPGVFRTTDAPPDGFHPGTYPWLDGLLIEVVSISRVTECPPFPDPVDVTEISFYLYPATTIVHPTPRSR